MNDALDLLGASSLTDTQKTELKRSGVSLVGAVAGVVLWKQHRWLGFFLGGAVGRVLGMLVVK